MEGVKEIELEELDDKEVEVEVIELSTETIPEIVDETEIKTKEELLSELETEISALLEQQTVGTSTQLENLKKESSVKKGLLFEIHVESPLQFSLMAYNRGPDEKNGEDITEEIMSVDLSEKEPAHPVIDLANNFSNEDCEEIITRLIRDWFCNKVWPRAGLTRLSSKCRIAKHGSKTYDNLDKK
eukprot:TRINITY_DN4692_c0_g1_i9.p1 TRINITY_DN4692_c0_g1~~TRINITY_DN4692_c0_g1_i9.p1  ORF type:complete len:185 (+),score=42.15 TRINITY_DN4692_c0_g1_i9:575-1129(+)